MERVSFLLRLRENTGDAYDKAHAEVWPQMLSLLKSAGIAEYSIFRRGTLLFLYMHVDNFEAAWSKIENDPVNLRWQAAMSEYFAPNQETNSGERFPMLREVFYLP